jgi:hypothetical protein
MALRKELYIGAAGAIVKLQTVIAALGNVEVPESQIMSG